MRTPSTINVNRFYPKQQVLQQQEEKGHI